MRHRRQQFVIPEAELRQLYEVERRSDRDIGQLFGCTAETVRQRRVHYGIPTIKAQREKGARLTPEVLRREYEGEGLTHEQIAARHGVCEDTARLYIHRMGLARQTSMTRRKQPPIFSDSRALAVLVGTVFGDGHLAAHANGSVRLELKHAMAQEEWLRFKVDALSPVLHFPWAWRGAPSVQEGWNAQDQVRAVSATHPDLQTVYSWFYGPEGRRLSPEALAHMTELSLAAWLVDDGTLAKAHRYTLYTMRYPEAEVHRAASFLTERFGLHPGVRRHRNVHVLIFPAADYQTISGILEREVGTVQAIRYKIKTPAWGGQSRPPLFMPSWG